MSQQRLMLLREDVANYHALEHGPQPKQDDASTPRPARRHRERRSRQRDYDI